MVTILSPHPDPEPTNPEDRSSRRALLSRLAGLGLVATGSLAFLPGEADAKPKQRRQRRRGKRRGTGGKSTKQRGGKLSAQEVVGNPRLSHPSYSNRPPYFNVSAPSNGYVYVTTVGRISFTADHVTLMRAGRRFRLTAQVWEADDNPDDYCFSYSTVFTYPTNASAPPRSALFSFARSVPSSWLNHDVDDGIFDFDDDEDDPYAQIRLWTLPAGSSTWRLLTTTNSNEDQGYY